ncbi:MAG TPA: L-seryl-tRNA(Sec) selenium transferase, partial [Caldilineaceae bacterium]|nr:L-seryl-tRNA(Sec) selenium transferase [Caldilineaceae bacterium]
DGLVVNNNAGAVFLVLSALCSPQEVVISRGELVEIGGGFRIPDVLRQSGAKLVEVGTTNRTHARDFAEALCGDTAAFMRVHASNFQQIGFVTKPSLAELVQIVRDSWWNDRVLVIDDLGSGTLLDTAPYGLSPEPTVQQSVAAGADVVTFSGDKLLGGPQAGLIVGKAESIEQIRRHPLTRALRVDKLTLAGLEATLQSYRRGKAVEEIPVWQMIAATPERLRGRAERWRGVLARAGLPVEVVPGQSTIGGGSLPGETLPTHLLALTVPRPDEYAARLRQANPPIVGRIQQERLLFDPRTVLPEEDERLLSTLCAGSELR